MKTQNTIQAALAAVTMIFAVTLGASMAFGQNTVGGRSNNSLPELFGPTLVGVWEQVNVPMEYDCTTGQPIPGTPIIRVMQSFNLGGTGWIEDTAPVEGPYRSTGATVWKRNSKLGYSYANTHYSFLPDNTFIFVVKQRSDLTLSRDGNSFTENGRFDVLTPDGNIVISGCLRGTAHRIEL